MLAMERQPGSLYARESDRLRIFALKGSDEIGADIARLLSRSLDAHEEREFEDGEHKARPLAPVCGADVYVIDSLHGDPDRSANDKLCRLLFFIGALKDAGAARVTAVVPYLCYSRKDRRTKTSDPVTTRYVATLFDAIGADVVVTIEVHNDAAFENAFRRRAIALTAAPLLIEAIRSTVGNEPLCVISPDLGGGKRADLLRQSLEAAIGRPVGKAFVEKHRSAGVVSGDLFAGEVRGATCVIVDDLISTGGTLVRAAQAARERGAGRILACVAHGLFMPGSEQTLADPAIDGIIVTDAVPAFRLPAGPVHDKLSVVSVAPLLAETIHRLHHDMPLSDLLVF